MKSKLDQLERYLQKIVENSAGALWKNERQDLVRKLMAAIEKESVESNNSICVPSGFVVLIHPKRYALWQENDDMLSAISAALQEIAVELDLPAKTRPSLFLESDPSIPEYDLQLQIISHQMQGTKTAILAAENSDDVFSDPSVLEKTFLILEDGEHFSLDRPVINIGRRDNNELMIDDPHISREHAQIRTQNGRHILFDLNSKGGTFVNGRKITQHNLQAGDVISLSGHPLIYFVENFDNRTPETKTGITSTIRLSQPNDDNEEHQ